MSCLIGIEKPLSSQPKGRDDVSQRRLSDVLLKAEMYQSPPVGSQENKADLANLLSRELLAQSPLPPPPIRILLLHGGFTDERQGIIEGHHQSFQPQCYTRISRHTNGLALHPQ